jgi:formiminoglutamase
MSGASSSAAGWSSLLEPASLPQNIVRRPDDPRLVDAVDFWDGNAAALTPGRAVLLGFPQDEGVRRNHGRPGAAQAPDAIRSYLYRLTPWDFRTKVHLLEHRPLDLGNVRIDGPLEEAQEALGLVIGAILKTGGIPLVLGGGHETAYGHYLGYLAAGKPVGIINLDAHLDVRPREKGQGHSGSPFRQALEHPDAPLPGEGYVCLGAQPHSVSQANWLYTQEKGCAVAWAYQLRRCLRKRFRQEYQRLAAKSPVYVSLDADVVRAADMPGVSAPNSAGLAGNQLLACARLAGSCPRVASFDLVEINPGLDPDGRSARWAALAVWHFLVGLALRLNPRG